MEKSVKIIYNDDGSDEYILDGEKIIFDDISKTALEIEESLKAAGLDYPGFVAEIVQTAAARYDDDD